MSKSQSTSTEAQIKELMETVKKQNEAMAKQQDFYNKKINTLEAALQMAHQENKKRAKEIEMLGRNLAGMNMGEDDDFTSFMTEGDDSQPPTRRPSNSALVPDPAMSVPLEQPNLRAKDAIRYIPVLNGDDDVGVEDFIKEVRSLRSMCTERTLLLKAIKVEKITGKAAQSIRNINIDSYASLYDALRSNVTVQASSDEFSEQLRDLKQGATESVQNFNIRFRRILNKLTYAITNEYPQPITRRVMMEATMKRVTRIYMNGLKREIGHMIFSSKPGTLIEAEKEASDIERYLREERHKTVRRPHSVMTKPGNYARRYTTPPEQRRLVINARPSASQEIRNRPSTINENTPFEIRRQIKCFKCGKIGHTSNQCVNFQVRAPQERAPPKIFNVETEESCESIQQVNNYQPSECEEQEEQNSSYLSTQEQESTYYEKDQYYEMDE
ncbi:unnamed protein product [Xylocopa violacea]|uniref:CCHC-type domain-containing protein n=1 Tax=Xylocopa violacea TaxID=135666 RepID=A0ABP1MYZ6_XYLVO